MRPVLLGALFLSTFACGKPASTGPRTSHVAFEGTGIGGGVTMVLYGVEILPEGNVSISMRNETVDGETLFTRRIEGHVVEVEERELFLGERSYGVVPAGTRVRIRPEGVFFDEEKVGSLPD